MDKTQIDYYLKTAESHARNLEFSLQQLRKLLNQQTADAEQCVQTEVGRDTVSEHSTSESGVFRMLWSCDGCKDDMYYSDERCCQCGKPNPNKPADSNPARLR